MLQRLHIENYALIEHLDIEWHDGFSVITGETGAGKSILLGAISLLLGQRADTKSIQTGASRCIIEAEFNLKGYGLESFFEAEDLDFDGQECILRRELTSAGKSRAFINDTPATVAQLKQLGEHLVDIHSQHQNLLLAKEDFQINVLDTMGQCSPELNAYRSCYHTYTKLHRELQEAEEQAQQSRDNEDYLRYQLQQLEEAKLQEDEEEELRNEAQTLEHAEDIKSALYQSMEILSNDDNGLLDALREARRQISSINQVYPQADELEQRLESAYLELKDVVSELESDADSIEFDPARLEEVTERLNLIYDLEQKHHVDSIKELIKIYEQLSEQVFAIDNSDEHFQQLRKQLQEAEQQMQQAGQKLTKKRQKAVSVIEKEMKARLVPLGIPNVQFHIELTPAPQPRQDGQDNVTFLFSANKNSALQPVSQVASGGEIARVMLSLKAMISGATKLPTIIFDEIDTGVSGQIAERMALIMREMGTEGQRQVISITHLPQIAAMGTAHYRVYKEDTADGTRSHIVPLTDEERVQEIAHMLSGSTLTEAAINNAKTLLQEYR